MKSKKVLIILNDLSGGGAERVFVNIANEFLAANVSVEFLLGRKQGVYFDILNPAVPVHELGAFNLLQYIKKIRAFLNRKEYTHIFTASDYITVATVLAKKRNKFSAKIIATLHYDLPYQLSILPLPQRVWSKYLNRHVISGADEIVAVSKGVAEGFQKIVGTSTKVKVIYNPVFDDSIFEKAAESIEEDFFKRGKITLVNVGRLEIQKNHKLLINTFHALLKHRPDLQLLIIGKGALEQELITQIEELSLQNSVQLLGFRQNPFAYIAKSDLFVLSSAYEGLPTVLIESLALGVNVASTDCPSGPSEILGQGKFGWLADNNNQASLVNAVDKALDSKHPSSFLKERALLFHKDNIIPQYLKLVD